MGMVGFVADGTSDPEGRGHALLARISSEMVRAQKEFFGKGPTSAKSYMLDDMLVTVMRGGLTTAEKTMLEFGHPDQVRGFRQLFENEMTERLTGSIEELTGRTVVNYQSQVMFDPDVIVELFVFDEPLGTQARTATAEGQLEDDQTGEVTADELGPSDPSESGQAQEGEQTIREG